MTCDCKVCEACIKMMHVKHEARRHMANLRAVVRVEYRPDMAKLARKTLNTIAQAVAAQ